MNNSAEARGMSSAGKFAWALVALLAILHYDFWNWDDRSLVFGFLPIGLFYQGLISIGAAASWALVVRFAWPTHIEEWAEEVVEEVTAQEVTAQEVTAQEVATADSAYAKKAGGK